MSLGLLPLKSRDFNHDAAKPCKSTSGHTGNHTSSLKVDTDFFYLKNHQPTASQRHRYTNNFSPAMKGVKDNERLSAIVVGCSRVESSARATQFRYKNDNKQDSQIIALIAAPVQQPGSMEQGAFAAISPDKGGRPIGSTFIHSLTVPNESSKCEITQDRCQCFASKKQSLYQDLSPRREYNMHSRATRRECSTSEYHFTPARRKSQISRTARSTAQKQDTSAVHVGWIPSRDPCSQVGFINELNYLPTYKTCKDFLLRNVRNRLKFSYRAKAMPVAVQSMVLMLLLTLLSTPETNAAFAGRRLPPPRSHASGLSRHNVFRRRQPKFEQCESITVPMCKDIGYNETNMSLSIIGKFTQAEAKKELDLFLPLVDVNCSAEVKLFLCSIYTPICMKGYGRFLPPCRFVCERARNGCFPFMKKYGYEWPNNLRCNRFPRYTGENQMCMHFNLTKLHSKKTDASADKQPPPTIKPFHDRNASVSKVVTPSTIFTSTASSTTTTSKITTTAKPMRDRNSHSTHNQNGPPPKMNDAVIRPVQATGDDPTQSNLSLCVCRAPMVQLTDRRDHLYNKVTTGGVPNCAVSCMSPYFSKEQHSAAEIWIKSWSIVCFVVTLMTVSTFLIDMERFKYPERPIIFLSTCYMFVSIGFLIRIIAGHEAVACASRTDHVLYHTTGPVLCTTVFLLVYFFSMASALWWVILSMTWFLAAGLKWGSEAIASYSQYYHAAAWLIPSLKSIMVLAMSSVDGDPLSGICLVGNQDVRALRGFVLAPLVVYLALGGMFLLAGFISLFRIRKSIKKDGTKTDKLEKLMGRIGVFSVLYMVPAAALVACYFYEQQYRPVWEYSHNCQKSFFVGFGEEASNSPKNETANTDAAYEQYNLAGGPTSPEFAVFMMRYLMTLLIGITNGVWICSPKTIASWKRFYRRCVCCLCGVPCQPSWKDGGNAQSKGAELCNGQGKIASVVSDKSNAVKTGTNSVSADDVSEAKDSSSRYDSIHSRRQKFQEEGDANIAGRRKSSRRPSGSISAKTSSDNSQLGRCTACETGDRQSRNDSRKHRSRKRRKSSQCDQRNAVGKVIPTNASQDDSSQAMICDGTCCSNTTTTDGSERHPACHSTARCLCSARHSPEHDHRHQSEAPRSRSSIIRTPISARGVGRARTPSSDPPCARHDSISEERFVAKVYQKPFSTVKDCVYHICDEGCALRNDCIHSNRPRYIINVDDELPPCIGFSYSPDASRAENYEYPLSSLPASDSEEDEKAQHVALLNKIPSGEPHLSSFQRHNHFHHHHYLGKTES